MQCYNCDMPIHDCIQYDPDDNAYCDSCYKNLDIATCHYCKETDWVGNLQKLPESKGMACDDCWNDYYASCDNCGKTMHHSDAISTYTNAAICLRCYENDYFTCNTCSEILSNDEYGENGECNSCSNNDANKINISSSNASEEEVEETKHLLLSPIRKRKHKVFYNPNDIYLNKIAESIGEVDHCIYLYGLIDREDYEIAISDTLFTRLMETMPKIVNSHREKMYIDIESSSFVPIIIRNTRRNRAALGTSRNLRENYYDWVVDFIKNIATKREENICAG